MRNRYLAKAATCAVLAFAACGLVSAFGRGTEWGVVTAVVGIAVAAVGIGYLAAAVYSYDES